MSLQKQNIQLCGPFTCLVAGSSGQGKSTLIANIVTQLEFTIKDPIEQVIWVYDELADQEELFQYVRNNCESLVTFIQGFPEKEISQNSLFPRDGKQRILVLDDMMHQIAKSNVFCRIFTFWARHNNVNVFCLLQNLYIPNCKFSATLIRNCSYILLLPCLKDSKSIRILASQVMPTRYRTLVEVYDQMCRESKRGQFIILDFTPEAMWNFRIRTGLLKDDKIYLYLDDEKK